MSAQGGRVRNGSYISITVLKAAPANNLTGLPPSRSPVSMCNFTLTLVESCGHELPITDYCEAAQDSVEAFKSAIRARTILHGASRALHGDIRLDHVQIAGYASSSRVLPYAAERLRGKRTYGGIADDAAIRRRR
ncbi:hypothetical protein BAUCODRAFT_267076 [Baudoinia panamericana UAMH 10762]|uniref:Uncharacterized protein n=1 Tax=Baudoinia panamericana (strain UAMH 10762) TaxID=717646 RepID=M2N2P6_BAUPA|nr:uncharacterized protein BAUCODRAFT_267076 [Baudoinia panamericana UAMH 10762]EMC92935.1 hypothetical protein BAUCODRAFT_267076 [Baudoinia panamericana UAMH 10762]